MSDCVSSGSASMSVSTSMRNFLLVWPESAEERISDNMTRKKILSLVLFILKLLDFSGKLQP